MEAKYRAASLAASTGDNQEGDDEERRQGRQPTKGKPIKGFQILVLLVLLLFLFSERVFFKNAECKTHMFALRFGQDVILTIF